VNASTAPAAPPLWQAVLFPALAGAMGWGIRGQYGHETGAMIAGLLISLTLALLWARPAPSWPVARAVAWGTLALGIGGSMTYGQTIGLTQNAPLIGNWAALGWGMLGLALKGGVWVGFAGALLGWGLSGRVVRPRTLVVMLLALGALCALGIRLLNEPFDPARRILPPLYFSADWRWEPDADLRPRREVWGGLWLALLGLLAGLRWVEREVLAVRLAGWGILGGALGFPLGQSLQAFHAWNPELFQHGLWAWLAPRINWWNAMETVFGAVLGAALGWGVWRNRRRLGLAQSRALPSWPVAAEWTVLGLHAALLVGAELVEWPALEAAYDFGLVLIALPLVATGGGRFAPWLVMGPVTLLPIAGKTARRALETWPSATPALIWGAVFAVPLLAAGVWAIVRARRVPAPEPAGVWLPGALVGAVWLYFALNWVMFRFPWPWAEWTARTPHALVFAACAGALTGWAAGLWRVHPSRQGD
jgi:hypothetical protein